MKRKARGMAQMKIELPCAEYMLQLDSIDYDAIPTLLESEEAAGRRIIDFGDPQYRSQTALHIQAIRGNDEHWALTMATHTPSGLDEHSAVCFERRLAVAVGSFVACIDVPTGELLWAKECDSATCFGIYVLADEAALIVHGELDITKLNTEGEMLWQSSGKDIFTGPFEIANDGIRSVDFYGNVYWIRLDSGDIAIIGQQEPPYPLRWVAKF